MPDAGKLPAHLRWELDIAIQHAEVEYLRSKKRAGGKWFERWNDVFNTYLSKIFFTFTSQACKAASEGLWTVEQVRQEVKAYSRKLIAEQYAEKWIGAVVTTVTSATISEFERDLKNSPRWAMLQETLLKVALQRPPRDGNKENAPASRRGYRKEVRDWMASKGISSVAIAATRLCVSESSLKSMMSSKGKLRYGKDSLAEVLKKIGVGPQ